MERFPRSTFGFSGVKVYAVVLMSLITMNHNIHLERFYRIENLSKNDTYIITRGRSNILFLGSCRTIVLAMFFEEICKSVPFFKNAQFGIQTMATYCVNSKIKTNNMNNTIENADIIVCEQLRNQNILNTHTKCEDNIYNNFNLKPNCRIIQIPNLHYYLDTQNRIDIKRLTDHCTKYGFISVSNTVANVPIKKLFATPRHPTNILILELLLEMCITHFNQRLPIDILIKLNKCKTIELII